MLNRIDNTAEKLSKAQRAKLTKVRSRRRTKAGSSEREQKAFLMAQQVKDVARSLEHDAKCYDVLFPLSHVERLKRIADEYLNLR